MNRCEQNIWSEAKHNPWDFTKKSMQINHLISVYRG